jgi:hypothetical protein
VVIVFVIIVLVIVLVIVIVIVIVVIVVVVVVVVVVVIVVVIVIVIVIVIVVVIVAALGKAVERIDAGALLLNLVVGIVGALLGVRRGVAGQRRQDQDQGSGRYAGQEPFT